MRCCGNSSLASPLRRLAATPLRAAGAGAVTPSPSAGPPSPPQQQRSVSHYYGALRNHAKGAANAQGAINGAPELTYMDRLRAEHILRTRMHLGHQKRKLNPRSSGAIYGFRHNVAIFDIKKTWRSLRTLFYGFAEMAQVRSSFFLLAPNPNLPLRSLIEKMRHEYPFKYSQFSSLYMTGYSDTKWIDGLFSNWKVTFEFYQHIKKRLREQPESRRFQRQERYLRGIEGVDIMAKIVPDFVLVFATHAGAIHEANNLDLPLFGMVDSNNSPAPFLYPVYGNDDSLESLSFMMELLKRGVEEGRKREHEAFALMMMTKMKEELDPRFAEPSDEFVERIGSEETPEPLLPSGPNDMTWNNPDMAWLKANLGPDGLPRPQAEAREEAGQGARMGAPVKGMPVVDDFSGDSDAEEPYAAYAARARKLYVLPERTPREAGAVGGRGPGHPSSPKGTTRA